MDEETAELERILKEDRRFEPAELELGGAVVLNEESQQILKQVG